MSNPIVDSLIQGLIEGIKPAALQAGLATEQFAEVAAKGFFAGKVSLVENWVKCLINKTLEPDDFKQLTEDLGIEALEVCLRIAGAAEVEVDKTRSVFLGVITSVVGGALGKVVAL